MRSSMIQKMKSVETGGGFFAERGFNMSTIVVLDPMGALIENATA